ncbi:MAG: hypothetical protein WKF60_06305 [Ilumatobacter sp.]
MRAFDTDGVQDGDRVVGHVPHSVCGTLLVEWCVGEVRRQADVAVVEPDHVEPGAAELLAPLGRVVDAL